MYLASDLPAEVAVHVDELLGAILPLCAPDRDASAVATGNTVDAVVAGMERESLRIRRDARTHRLAQTVGRCASARTADVLAAVLALFTATTGDEVHDRAVRTTMIDVLEEAASPETLRNLLPITYSALLDGDHVVRAAGIDLWVACAGVADTLPLELIELSEALLQDRYVIVHRRMLRQLPRLRVPAAVAAKLLPIVTAWVITYAKADEPDALRRPSGPSARSPTASRTTRRRSVGTRSHSHRSVDAARTTGRTCSPHGGPMRCVSTLRGPGLRSRRRRARNWSTITTSAASPCLRRCSTARSSSPTSHGLRSSR